MAAPVCLAIVGALNLIAASGQDFSLYSDEKTKFEVLNWPGSFKACLHQVSSSVGTAFRFSHKNMDFIRLSMQRVPGVNVTEQFSLSLMLKQTSYSVLLTIIFRPCRKYLKYGLNLTLVKHHTNIPLYGQTRINLLRLSAKSNICE